MENRKTYHWTFALRVCTVLYGSETGFQKVFQKIIRIAFKASNTYFRSLFLESELDEMPWALKNKVVGTGYRVMRIKWKVFVSVC